MDPAWLSVWEFIPSFLSFQQQKNSCKKPTRSCFDKRKVEASMESHSWARLSHNEQQKLENVCSAGSIKIKTIQPQSCKSFRSFKKAHFSNSQTTNLGIGGLWWRWWQRIAVSVILSEWEIFFKGWSEVEFWRK